MRYLLLLLLMALCSGVALSEPLTKSDWHPIPTPKIIVSPKLMMAVQGDAIYLYADSFKYKPRPKPKPKRWRDRRGVTLEKKKPVYTPAGAQILKLKNGRWQAVSIPGSQKAFRRLFLYQGSLHVLGDALYRYDGANWSKVGSAFKPGIFDIAVSEQGIYIAHFWRETLYVSTLVGGEWIELGGPVARAGRGASIAILQGECYAARHRANGSVSLHRYRAGKWSKVAELSERIPGVNEKVGASVQSDLLAHGETLAAAIQSRGGVSIIRDVLGKSTEDRLTSHGRGLVGSVSGPDDTFYSYFTDHVNRNGSPAHKLRIAKSSPQGTIQWGEELTSDLCILLGSRTSSAGIAITGRSLFVAYVESHKGSYKGKLKLLKRVLQ